MYKLLPYKQDLSFVDEVINATTSSKSVRLDGVEGLFAMQVKWEAGSAVDMALSLELSNNNVDWVEVPNSIIAITTDSGDHMWDIQSGAQFLRVKVTVTGGSATFNAAFNGSTR